MPFLYEKIDSLREFGNTAEMPAYIAENLNPAFELRPYQRSAFENYVTWFESRQRPHPIQNLFHMATGSGKTLIMAGLMIYLYKKGYRNFLFFVNLTNIVKKTKENFLNKNSSKFLFAEDIVIDGERVPIKEVNNFQHSDLGAINIRFTTTQGLHADMWFPKENAVTFDDFKNQKVVLISDEAHHLNVDTRNLSGEEEENYHSWESTVRNIFETNKDNVLLEFTATCDLTNQSIKAEYEDKIIFDYQLAKFRADGYSKEINSLRCDISVMDRAIQAIVLSQYRMKVFQDNRLSIKPVVLFKSAKIADSKENMNAFIEAVSRLTGGELERISKLTDNETMQKVWRYFSSHGISFDQLAQELREEFSAARCISANDDSEAEEKQIILNSLEDENNPYRAIFEVKKLDEGWDVLNLFDIVRMYETRQSSGSRLSSSTVSEAQLIGRGARYCPFKIDDEQEKYKRKYDSDTENPLHICEELYYHCQNDSRYIDELKRALRKIGIDIDKTVSRTYKLKDSFKADPLYQQGYVFMNDRMEETRDYIYGLLPSVRNKIYKYSVASGSSGEDSFFGIGEPLTERVTALYTCRKTFSDIAEINYAIVNKALCKFNVFRFDILKTYFPNLSSTREFIFSGDYLGQIIIEITSPYEKPSCEILHFACISALSEIGENISSIEKTYEGSTEFKAYNIRDVFTDKTCNYTDPHDDGVGISQNDVRISTNLRLDLSNEDWFAFNDNYGTSEEKAFVVYFKKYVDKLKKKYDKVYLVRNERQLHIYSFDSGERFEPDYVLFLHTPTGMGYEQLQVFIEPKGTHLIENDRWKEEFLLQLESKAVPIVTFADDNKYRIWGFHFFNQTERAAEFDRDFDRL